MLAADAVVPMGLSAPLVRSKTGQLIRRTVGQRDGEPRGDPRLRLYAGNVVAWSRGLMRGLVTRAYFQGEKLNEADPLLASIEEPGRRATLIARPAGAGAWRMDVRLQGEAETVFLDV